MKFSFRISKGKTGESGREEGDTPIGEGKAKKKNPLKLQNPLQV